MGPGSGVTIRPELGQCYLEIDLMSLRAGYVGFRLMPLAVMEREAGVYPKVDLANLVPKITLDMMRRGPDGSYPRSTWVYGSDNFATEEFGLEEPIDDRQARILRYHGLDPDQIAADRSTASAMRALETSIAANVQDATTHSSKTTAVTNEWDDATNATPITDVKGAIERFEARNAGLKPNKLVMNLKQARNALLTDQVRGVIGYRPSEGLAQEQLMGNALMLARFESILAMVLGVPEVVIADGFSNSKLPGVAGSYARIWSDEYVSLVHAAQGGQDLRQIGYGRVMAWTGDGGGTGQTISVEDYYQPNIRSRVIRARFDLQIKTVHSDLIEILSNITT
jgi:hypothetical protein